MSASVIEITSPDMQGVEPYFSLTEHQLRNKLHSEKGLFIAESPKVIGVALDAGYKPVSLLTSRKHIEGDAALVISRCGNIPIYTGDDALLERITGFKVTRGVLCAMHRPSLPTVEDVCKGKRRIVIIDNVVDSTNVGAIFRSAAALGIDGVLLTPTSCDPLNRRSVRVSMGSVFLVPWTYLGDTEAAWPSEGMSRLHSLGFRVASMALKENSVSIDDKALQAEPHLAIVMGTEGEGLTDEVINASDYVVRIPMSHNVDSLNVAAAAAVAFWQLTR
ncbi:MAG: RNA methyltransferase [Bacteroidaceae bacterium]|nr:RNA methyltransferase [Bacteroidaceae bacterium]